MMPNGFVNAASSTSQTLSSIRSHSSASSLTRAMLTARNVFSNTFTISAALALDTGTTRLDGLRIKGDGHASASSGRCRRRPCWCSSWCSARCRDRRVRASGHRKKSTLDLQARRFEDRQHDFFGGAGIGGRFEADELAGPQIPGQLAGHAFDELQIGIEVLGQRRRHADDDDVHLRHLRVKSLTAREQALLHQARAARRR